MHRHHRISKSKNIIQNKSFYRNRQFSEWTQDFKFIENGRRGYNELAVALLDGKLSYPSVVFLNEKMERITVLAGYRGPDDFYPILQYIGSGAYQSKTFEEYQQGL